MAYADEYKNFLECFTECGGNPSTTVQDVVELMKHKGFLTELIESRMSSSSASGAPSDTTQQPSSAEGNSHFFTARTMVYGLRYMSWPCVCVSDTNRCSAKMAKHRNMQTKPLGNLTPKIFFLKFQQGHPQREC